MLRMRRKVVGEKLERFRLERAKTALVPVRQKSLRWANDAATALRHADPTLPDGLDNRLGDNWRRLVAITDAAGGAWPSLARAAATASAVATADEGVATLLLEDIRRIFTDKGVTRLPSGEIVERLLLLEERPWPEWGRDHKGITLSRLAKLLDPFNVRPGTIWLPNGQTPKGYKLEDFADAFQRYLTPAEAPDQPLDTPDEAVV